MKRTWLIILSVISAVAVVATGLSVVLLNSNYMYSKNLCSAIERNDIEAVQKILAKKPSCVNTLPTLKPKWVRAFLEERACYPLSYACFDENDEMIELLLDNGADININDGFPALSRIYGQKKEGWYKTSLMLISRGADINYTTENSGKNTPVLCDIVEKSCVNAPIEYDDPENVVAAFEYAFEHCDRSRMDWAHVLGKSVSGDRLSIVEFLLDSEYCDVNMRTTTGNMTPLMFAARDSTLEMVSFLLEKGADKTVKDDHGLTAYDYAVSSFDEAGRDEVLAMLKV